MSSYTVAGSADNEDTATCETIANEIKKYYKNIDFRIIIKHPKEWEEYIHEICRTYGFKKKINPIIFTLDGKLIGGIDQFKEMGENKFGIDVSSLVSTISTKINMKQVEKEVAAKKKIKKGKRTLQEKIQDSLKQKYEDSSLHPVKGIFQSDINEGLQFYVKYEDRLCPHVYIAPEQLSEVQRQIITPADLDIMLIAARDNYPPEVCEDEEKSISHAGSRKHQTENSQIGITPRDMKGITPRDLKSRENEATKTKSDFGANPKLESQGQLEDQQSIEPEGATQQNIPSQNLVQDELGQVQPSMNEGLHIIAEESNQIPHHEDQEKEKKEKKSKKCLIENSLPCKTEIIPEIFDLSPHIIKQMKNTNYYLAFHPYPLFDGQVILFEKYPNLNPDDYKEEKIESSHAILPPIAQNSEAEHDGKSYFGDAKSEAKSQRNQSFVQDHNEVQEKTKVDLMFDNNKKLLLNPNAVNIIDFSRTERERKIRENGKKHKELYEEQQKKLLEISNNQKQQQQQILAPDHSKENNVLNAEGEEENNVAFQQGEAEIYDEEESLLAPPQLYDFKSRCNRDWIDIVKPLSKLDWKVISKVMKKLCCLVTYQILPHGYQTHLPLSTGVVNLFLRKFMISTHTNQSILPHLQDSINQQQPEITHLPFEQTIIFDKPKAKKVNKYYTIPTLQFEHAIHYFKDKKIKKKKIIKKFRKIVNALAKNPEDKLKMGFNLILTQDFMLVVPLKRPHSYFNNTPLFLHPLAYLGYLHLPKLIQKWPTTAYKVEDLTSSLQRLNTSTVSY